MAGIIPIPTTRVSGMLTRQRLLAQLQSDQLDLFRLQNQVSTGRRITLPSEDAPAAQRAITLQRLIERKEQLRSNAETGSSFLGSTDQALNDVAQTLGDLRGAVLGVAGTTSTDSERQAALDAVNSAIDQMLSTANTQFRGRYLFAGTQTNVVPYSRNGDYIHYAGDDAAINNFSDLGVLFSTNAPGAEVFGGISSQVLGGVDLNPQVSADTPLSSLRSGRGISPNGALQISDGTNSVIVDISRAVTVGDVARVIEATQLPGRQLTATVTGQGLTLQLDAGGGGNLTVTEVASGKTASELGILEKSGVSTAPLVGRDLDPLILRTTRLDDLLGSRAQTRLTSPGTDNDLIITAAANGAQYSGVNIQLVNDELLRASAGLVPGDEVAEFDGAARAARGSVAFSGAGNDLTLTAAVAGVGFNNVRVVIAGQTGLGDAATAVYDSANKRLTITVDDAGATSVGEVVNAIAAEGTFVATPDASAGETFSAAALIDAGDIGAVQGETGNSGGAAGTLYVRVAASASTANQVASAINAQGTFTARLDAFDTTTTLQAGNSPVSLSSTATTSGGSGTTLDRAHGLTVEVGDTEFELDFSEASTVQDLLNVLNGSDAGLHAELNADGTGIDIQSRLSGAYFRIDENGGQMAEQLGVRSFTTATWLDDMNRGVGVPTKADSILRTIADNEVITDFTIVVDDGAGGTVDLAIDIRKAASVQDVLDIINNHPQNNTGGVAIVARTSATANGIEVVDANGRPLTINAAEGSEAAEYLGLIPEGATTVTGAGGTISGTDRNYLESSSVFTTLIRLRDALTANDINAISRGVADIDADIERVTSARADVGARAKALDVSIENLEDEDVQLRSALSEEIEVDLVEAISNLTARQVSLQASLQAMAQTMQLTLLNYL